MTPDVIYDQLIGMGLVKKMIFSYAGNPGVGLLRRFRDSVEKGGQIKLKLKNILTLLWLMLMRQALGLPCAIFRGYMGAEPQKS